MFLRAVLLIVFIFSSATSSFAFWVWTPETNEWINPKYHVKATPAEQLAYAKTSYDSKDYDKAIKEFRKLLKHYPKAREAAEAQFYIGLSMEAEDKLYDAFKNYQTVIDKYPFSDLSPQVIKKQYELANSLLEGREKRNKFLTAVAGDSYDVIDIFKAVIKNAPYGELAAPSQYKIGLYLQEKQLYQEARDEFEKVVNDYPDSEWAKAAQYQIALVDSSRSTKAQYDQGVTKIAVQEFEDFVKSNPDAELSNKAQEHIHKLRDKEAENTFLVAKFYEKQKQYDSAKIYYNTIVDEYSNTKWATKAMERLREINNRPSVPQKIK